MALPVMDNYVECPYRAVKPPTPYPPPPTPKSMDTFGSNFLIRRAGCVRTLNARTLQSFARPADP